MVLADAVPLLLGPLFLVSGLIPSVMFANKQATSTLVDAISGAPPPSTDSPPLRSAPLLFYPDPPRVADVRARTGVSLVCDGKLDALWATTLEYACAGAAAHATRRVLHGSDRRCS